jgi:hypothetical protein
MKKLQLWCIRSVNNLEQISRELQMLEHRRKLESMGPAQPPAGSKQFFFYSNSVI